MRLAGRRAYIELAVESCSSMEGLSAGAQRLATVAVEWVDMTAVEQMTDLADLDRALDSVVLGLRRQPDRIEP